jgi:hypothetical protein
VARTPNLTRRYTYDSRVIAHAELSLASSVNGRNSRTPQTKPVSLGCDVLPRRSSQHAHPVWRRGRLNDARAGSEAVKQPLTEVRGFILKSKQTFQNSPNMPGHRSLDRARHVNVLCRTATTCQLAPESPLYLVVHHRASMGLSAASNIVAQFIPATDVAGFLAESSMKMQEQDGRRPNTSV